MEQDWDAVAEAITDRMRELGLTQRDLANRADVGLSTVQELRLNTRPRRRNPKVLAAISEGLEWPAGKLKAIADGRPDETLASKDDRIAELNMRLDRMQKRLDEIEQQLREDS